MWPWSDQPDITTLLQRNKERVPRSAAAGADDNLEGFLAASSSNQRSAGLSSVLPSLIIRAPGLRHGKGEDAHDGVASDSFSASADVAMDDALLDAAVQTVRWLQIRFGPPPRGPVQTRSEEPPPPPFPTWLFRIVNLKGLSLEGYPHPTLPETVGELTNLERLHCYGSALVRVPRSVGRLRNLVELDLYTSYGLHYLPIEVLRCPNLRSSRFSTRALYANYKNNLPLPPLKPWWVGDAQTSDGESDVSLRKFPTFSNVRDLVVRIEFGRNSSAQTTTSERQLQDGTNTGDADNKHHLPSEIVEHCVLPFLAWNYCSVCNAQYVHELGVNAWSHRRVATDNQSLLAFCCSRRCARQVQKQAWFDVAAGANLHQPTPFPTARRHRRNANGVRSSTWKVVVAATKKTLGVRWYPETFEGWEEEHLRPWPMGTVPPMDPDGPDFPDPPLPIDEPNEEPNEEDAASGDRKNKQRRKEGRPIKDKSGAAVASGVPDRPVMAEVKYYMRVLESGDIREQPHSEATEVGRLRIGDVISVVGPRHIDSGGREWVRFRHNQQKNGNGEEETLCWTAVTKKNGDLKLEETTERTKRGTRMK